MPPSIDPTNNGQAATSGSQHPADGSFPSATIDNGIVQATLYLPDSRVGYYRGSRFDWSGVVGGLTYGRHSYAGPWFPVYDPRIHDAISGPVESFLPIGFKSARPGETFLAIGIGTLRRPDENPYHFSFPYEIVDGGKWRTTPGPAEVEFIHELKDEAGHAYVYTKTVRLVSDEPVMRVEHRLQNTGPDPLVTSVFNHNFFMLDHQPTGPSLSITFAFDLQPIGPARGFGDLAEVLGNQIRYRRDLRTDEIVASEFQGFGNSSSHYDIRLENAATGAGMRITSDRPMSRLYFWSIRNTACPEPYLELNVEPGSEFTWTISYELYDVGAG